MKPILINHLFAPETANDIALAAARDHEDFFGCFNSNGCGQIYFYGINVFASTEVLNDEPQQKASSDWAEFIREMKNTKYPINAVALTLIRGRMECGREILYKETCYINNRNDSAIFMETDLVSNGANGPVFSKNTKVRRVPFSSILSVFKLIYDELGIYY